MTRPAVGAARAVVSAELREVLAAQRATYLRRKVSEQPWRQVQGAGWPRPRPRVIRIGHPVRALLIDDGRRRRRMRR